MPPDDRAGGAPQRLTLAWVGEDTLEARFPIQKAGMYLGAVQLANGDRAAARAAEPARTRRSSSRAPDPEEGQKTLREMARVTGGIERTAWDDVFNASRLRNRQMRDLVIPLALVLLLLHVMEIAGRRLLLFAAARSGCGVSGGLVCIGRSGPANSATEQVLARRKRPRWGTRTVRLRRRRDRRGNREVFHRLPAPRPRRAGV